MRILAALWAVLAVTVWWAPLSRPAQSAALGLACLMSLALRSAMKRADLAVRHLAEVENAARPLRDGESS